MRKFLVVSILLIATMALFSPVASAQTALSTGCTASADSNGAVPDTITDTFATGEVISVKVISADGGLFDVTIAGNLLLDDAPTTTSTQYEVLTDGSITIQITVTGGTGTYEVDCEAADEDAFDGTICHIPPGNPDAAHTITVGSENAVEKHISNHGDTLGACGEGVETRADLPDVNITVFIIFATDSIQIFGDCTDVCEEVLNMPIILIVDLNIVVVNGEEGDVFMDVENPEDFGFELDEVSSDGMSIVIYYLHSDPDDPTTGVFQINIYKDGTLLDDSILIFMNVDGEIVSWTSHNVWDEEADS